MSATHIGGMSKLTSQVLECQSCGSTVQPEDAYCQSCGKEYHAPKPQLSTVEVEANTERFYQVLLPSREQLMNPILRGNAIQQRLILCYGRQASGKSAKAETIVARVKQVYGTKNVGVQEAQGEGFRAILAAEKWPRRMITVIVLHDCTNVKFREEELRDFWRIRHIMQAKTGLNRGLVLLIFTAHTFFELPSTFRTDTDVILMSDMPSNPFHKQQYETHFIPKKVDQDLMRILARGRLNDPRLCGYAYMLDHGEPSGFIYLAQTEEKRSSFPMVKLAAKLLPILFKRKVRQKVEPIREIDGEQKRNALAYLILLMLAGLAVYSGYESKWLGVLLFGGFAAILVYIVARKQRAP